MRSLLQLKNNFLVSILIELHSVCVIHYIIWGGGAAKEFRCLGKVTDDAACDKEIRENVEC